MPLEFVSTDITTMPVDAIVSPCSPHPIVTESLNGTVYRAAGEALLAARQNLGALPFGDSAISSAFQLPAKYIIHAAIPNWHGGMQGEADILRRCYETIFHIALQNRITSLALPLLGYSAQGFPYELARNIFLEMFTDSQNTEEIYLYLVNTANIPPSLLADWHAVHDYITCLFTPSDSPDDNLPLSSGIYHLNETDSHTAYCDLTMRLSNRERTFSDTLMSIIEHRGLKEPTVYKKANIDRKLFSKIKTNPNYQPTKTTALAFAIALELTLPETNDLLRSAGYTLTYSSKSDIIVEYFITKKEYDIFTINEALFAFGEASLGSHRI